MSKIGTWMKARKNILFAAAAIAVLTAGMSLAFFTDAETAANTVKTGEVQIETDEKLEGLKKTDISVKGTGTSACYVRMRVDVPVLSYGDGEILSPEVEYNDPDDAPQTVSGQDWNGYENGKKIGTGDSKDSSVQAKMADWVKMEDGYWYLSIALEPEDTAVLCSRVEYKDLVGEDGTLKLPNGISKDQLSIVVYAEAVQADNMDTGDKTGADAAYAAFQKLKDENQ